MSRGELFEAPICKGTVNGSSYNDHKEAVHGEEEPCEVIFQEDYGVVPFPPIPLCCSWMEWLLPGESRVRMELAFPQTTERPCFLSTLFLLQLAVMGWLAS